SRLFFYAMPDNKVTTGDLVAGLTGRSSYRAKLVAAHDVVKAFLEARHQEIGAVRSIRWDRDADPPGVVAEISRWAELLAQLRGVVSVAQEHTRNGEEFVSYYPPNIEVPYRASSALYNLARGRALLVGRRQLCAEDVELVKHVALSSAPAERGSLLRALLASAGVLTTADVAARLKVTAPTARKFMWTWALLDVAEMAGNDATGYTLRLAPAWEWCREGRRDTDTGSSDFQGDGGESQTEVCESAMEVIRL